MQPTQDIDPFRCLFNFNCCWYVCLFSLYPQNINKWSWRHRQFYVLFESEWMEGCFLQLQISLLPAMLRTITFLCFQHIPIHSPTRLFLCCCLTVLSASVVQHATTLSEKLKQMGRNYWEGGKIKTEQSSINYCGMVKKSFSLIEIIG